MTMKTIEQWLNELPEPYRSQALENTPKYMLTNQYVSMVSVLMHAFPWKFSPQGLEYWQEYFNTLPR